LRLDRVMAQARVFDPMPMAHQAAAVRDFLVSSV